MGPFVRFFLLKLLLLVSIGYCLGSCSIKKSEDITPEETLETQTLNEGDLYPDKDGDGLSDALESKIGRRSDIGNFPKFKVANFQDTTFFFDGIGVDRKTVKFSYGNTNPNYSLRHEPIRDAIARSAYEKLTSDAPEVSEINLDDLNILKISNYNAQLNRRASKFIVENVEGNETNTSIKVESVFSILASDVLGIEKISDISATLGFIGEEGEFSAIGNSFYLQDIDGVRLHFEPQDSSNEAYSSSFVQIRFDDIDLGTYRQVFDEGYDLALKINNYIVKTRDGQSFDYLGQIAKATQKCSIYAISDDENDQVIFNSNLESIESTLERLFGSIQTDGENGLLAVGDKGTDSDFPIRLDEYFSDHLQRSAWHFLSSKNDLKAVLGVGESALLGYFKNFELSKAIKKKNLKYSINGRVIDDVGVACGGNTACSSNMGEFQVFNSESGITLKNLNLGETVELWISGASFWPEVSSPENRVFDVTARFERCTTSGPIECYLYPERYTCKYTWSDFSYKKSLIKDDPYFFLGKYMKIIPEGFSRPVHLDDRDFFNLYVPEQINDEDLLITFKVTQKLLDKYGSQVYLDFPEISRGSFNHGFLGFESANCTSTFVTNDPRDYYLLPAGAVPVWEDQKVNSGQLIRDYQIKINRFFSN